tara:strand:- start:3074 stop:5116 length:2043 start_codon:yes stop_codon:yes gene_type:complete
MKYRPDIDGLRAIAIIPVVVFHASLPVFSSNVGEDAVGFLSGGFVGVDIFFVISGFLITSLIWQEVTAGTFSFLRFYERRARRLLPALYAMMLTSLGLGVCLLYADEMKALAASVFSALCFAANIHFFMEVNYFASSVEFMPMLHNWSLAVEEQFYVLWPFVLFAGWSLTHKFKRRRLAFWAGGALILLSFGASVWGVLSAPSAGFYFLPFRLWELAVGGLLAFVMIEYEEAVTTSISGWRGELSFWVGCVGMCLPMFVLDHTSSFPGFHALPVVFGAVLVLASGGQPGHRSSRLLTVGPLVWIGKISYSLYLIHWPLFSFFRIYRQRTYLLLWEGLSLICLSIVLAVCSYHLIENPVRYRASRSFVFHFAASGGVLLMLLSVGVLYAGGVSLRKPMPTYARSHKVMWRWPCQERLVKGLASQKVCIFGESWETAKKRIVLWGDSHAEHYAPLVKRALAGRDMSVLLWKRSPPHIDHIGVKRWLKGSLAFSQAAGKRHEEMLRWLRTHHRKVDMLLLAGAWTGYVKDLFVHNWRKRSRERGRFLTMKGLSTLIGKLDAKLPVFIFAEIPRPNVRLVRCVFEDVRRSNPLCKGLPRARIDRWHQPMNAALQRLVMRFKNVRMLNAVEKLCSKQRCPVFVRGRILYSDANHLRRNFRKDELDVLVGKLGLREMLLQVLKGGV